MQEVELYFSPCIASCLILPQLLQEEIFRVDRVARRVAGGSIQREPLAAKKREPGPGRPITSCATRAKSRSRSDDRARERFSGSRLEFELFFNPGYPALMVDEILSMGVAILYIALVDSI
jgi:hypothetical protein